MLNERASRLIGQTSTVETAIENGKGRVRVGDGVWNARGPDAPAGSQVTVISADGSSLRRLDRPRPRRAGGQPGRGHRRRRLVPERGAGCRRP